VSSDPTIHGDPLVPQEEAAPEEGAATEAPEPDAPEAPEPDAPEDAATSESPDTAHPPGADAPPVDPLADAEARAQEYLDLARRKQAEFENFRRRMNLQAAQSEDRGVAKLAKELLPALDHLELALGAAEKHAGEGEWVKGIRLVQEEVLAALGRVGIQPFAPYGEPFDPNEHEAVAHQPVEEHEPGHVAEVYQQGYRLNGAMLRPARVVVAQ
jgi:molecular chaperone GrpE